MATVGYTQAVKHDVYRMTGETGSYIYMAPEVVRSEQYNEKVCPRAPERWFLRSPLQNFARKPQKF